MGNTMANHFGFTGRMLRFWLMLSNATSMLLFGYDQGVFGGILTLQVFEERFGLKGEEMLKGVIVGSYDIGCLVGALATSWVGFRVGRRRSILIGAIAMAVGACLQFLAPSFTVMTTGRVISGLGNGMTTATAPVWASETSKTTARGKNGMALMVINIAGLALSCWITYFFSFNSTELSWRFPLGFQLLFVAIIFGTAIWLPESPRWLIMKGKYSQARAVMLALEDDHPDQNAVVAREFEEIKEAVELEQAAKSHLQPPRQTMPTSRLVLGIGVQAMQQLTGINIICYYLPYVLTESVGLPGSTARLLAASNSMTYLFATFGGLALIDRWGRRNLMIYGAMGQTCCWLAITVLLDFANDAGTSLVFNMQEKRLGSGSVFFFFLFNMCFGFGWQGVSWLYPTEINSTRNRIMGMSFGVATNWLINFAVVFITPIGITRTKAFFYVIWTILNFLMVPTIYFFYPETAGRSLEDIDGMFEANPTIWAFLDRNMTAVRRLSDSRPQPAVVHPAGVLEGDVPLRDLPSSRAFTANTISRPHCQNRDQPQPSLAQHPGTLVEGMQQPIPTDGDDDDIALATPHLAPIPTVTVTESTDIGLAPTLSSVPTSAPSLGPQASTRRLL